MRQAVGMDLRRRLRSWEGPAERAYGPTPIWMLRVTATWPRVALLAAALGGAGFVKTLFDPEHLGAGDDVGGLLGGVVAAVLFRYVVRRRERILSLPSVEAGLNEAAQPDE